MKSRILTTNPIPTTHGDLSLLPTSVHEKKKKVHRSRRPNPVYKLNQTPISNIIVFLTRHYQRPSKITPETHNPITMKTRTKNKTNQDLSSSSTLS